MNQTEVRGRLCRMLKEIAPDTEPAALQDGDSLRDVLGIDSFDALRFIVAVDEELGVDIPEKDYSHTATLGQLLAYLKEKLP
jgi:acyl carrier protein